MNPATEYRLRREGKTPESEEKRLLAELADLRPGMVLVRLSDLKDILAEAEHDEPLLTTIRGIVRRMIAAAPAVEAARLRAEADAIDPRGGDGPCPHPALYDAGNCCGGSCSLATPIPADVAEFCEEAYQDLRKAAEWVPGLSGFSLISELSWRQLASALVSRTRLASQAAEVERVTREFHKLDANRSEWANFAAEAAAAKEAAEAAREQMRAALEAVELARHTDEEAHWLRATKLTDAALNQGGDHAEA